MNVSRLFRTALLSVLAFVLVGGIMTAQAQDIFVDAGDGNDNNDGTSASSPFATIQKAFDEAGEGDVIRIDGGTFYNETATLTKDVEIQIENTPVLVDGLVLDAGANTAPDNRAIIAKDDTDELEVATELEVASGFYDLGSASELELEDGATLRWSAGEPASGVRFADDQSGSSSTRLALEGSTYDLVLATGDGYQIGDTQLPNGSNQLNDLTATGAANVETPSDLTDINGNLTVESGGSLEFGSTTGLKGGSATVNGSLTGELEVSAAGAVLSGSGTYDDLDVANSADTDSPITVGGTLDLGASFDVTSTPTTSGGELTLSGSQTIVEFTESGGSITTGSGSGVVVTGSDQQTIDIGDPTTGDTGQRNISFLTVDKTGVNPLLIDGAGDDGDELRVAENFALLDGRVSLDNSNGADEDLNLAGSAEINGAILRSGSGSQPNLEFNQTSDVDIAGNGQIEVEVLASPSSGNTVTFTELSSIGPLEHSGSGTLQFDQQVEVAGNVDLTSDGTLTYDAGTASSSSGNVTVSGGSTVDFNGPATIGNLETSDGSASVTFADDATVGALTDLTGGTVTFESSSSIGSISYGNLSAATDVDLEGDATVSGNVDLNIDGSSAATLDVSGNASIGGNVTVSDNDNGNATLTFQRSASALKSTIGGTLTINSPSDGAAPTSEVVVEDNNDNPSPEEAGHSLEVAGGIDFEGNGSEEQLTVGSAGSNAGAGVTITLGSGGLDPTSASGLTLQDNVSLAFTGSANSAQTFTYSGGLTIDTLRVDNSRAESNGNAVVLSGGNLNVEGLKLLDGRVDGSADTDQVTVNGGTLTGGEVIRGNGSLESDNHFANPGDTYALTYENSNDVEAGPEYSKNNSNLGALTFAGSGTVTLPSSETVTSGNDLEIEDGATVASDGSALTVDNLGEDGTPLTANGSFTGSGEIQVNASSDNTYTLSGSGSVSTLKTNVTDTDAEVSLGLSATVDSLVADGSDGTLRVPEDGLSQVGGATIDRGGVSTGKRFQLDQTLVVDGDFDHESGKISLGSGDIDLEVRGANSTVDGSLAGYEFDGVGYVVFNGESAQTLTVPSDVTINRFELDNSDGLTIGGNFTLITADLLLTAGTLDGGSQLKANTSSDDGRIAVTAGSFSGDFQTGEAPAEVVYNNGSDLAAGAELSSTVNDVIVQGSAQVNIDNPVTVTDRLNLAGGTLASGENLTLDDTQNDGLQVTRSGGSLTGSPTFATDYGLRYSPSSSISTGVELASSVRPTGITVDAADQTVTLDGNASTEGVDLNAGTLQLGEDSLRVFNGTATINSALEASGNGAVVLDGGDGASEINGTYTSLPTVIASKDQNSNGVFQTATIDRVSSANSSENVAIDGNLIAESGNLVLGNSQVDNVSVSGDFTVASGARQFNDNGNSLLVAGDYTNEPAALKSGEDESDVNRLVGGGSVVLNGSANQSVTTALGDAPDPSGGTQDEDEFDGGLEVDNSAGVTVNNDIVVGGTLSLQDGVVDTGENLLAVAGDAPGDVTGTGAVDGALRRDLGGDDAGSFEFPLSVDGSLQEATIVTDGSTFPNSDVATVTVTTQGSEFAGSQGLPFTTGSGGSEVEVNTKAPVGWTVSFDPEGSTPAAGEAPDFRFRAQGLEGIGDVNQLRVISRAGEGETGNPFSVAGTHEDALFSGGIPLAVSSGVGGFDISNTQQFTFGSDSAVNDFADADQPATQEIAGTVTYPTVENGDLVGGRSIEGAEVTVSSSDTTATATTGANGEYQIDGLPSGDFDVEVSVSDSVENVSIADALRLIRGSAGTDPFAGAFQREQVADVNASGTANATDALRIARFDLGLADGFEAGDFATESESVTLESDGVTGVELFVAEVGDVDLSGGDTGGSSQTLAASTISPKQAAAATQSSSASGPETGVKAGETFEVPVRMGRSAEVGSYRMTVNYSAETASFEGVKSAQEGVLTNASSDGTLQVSWFDQSGESALDLRNGSELITLQFKASEDVKKKEFAPKVTSGEITDPEAAPLAAGVELQAVQIGASAPDKFALNGNYPNPVRGQATIDMDLPTSGNVTVEVYNVLGQRVQTMERSMSAGSGQTIKIDGSNLASGQYFYRVEADLEDGSARETGRITVVK